MSKKHDPKRFLYYQLLEDESGFKLPSGEEFKFDEKGGWTDEFGNKYDSNGNPIYEEDLGDEIKKIKVVESESKDVTAAPSNQKANENKPTTEKQGKIEDNDAEDKPDSECSWDRSNEEYEDEEDEEFEQQAELIAKLERKKQKQKSILLELEGDFINLQVISLNGFGYERKNLASCLAQQNPPIIPIELLDYPEDELTNVKLNRGDLARILEFENNLPSGLDISFYLDEEQDQVPSS